MNRRNIVFATALLLGEGFRSPVGSPVLPAQFLFAPDFKSEPEGIYSVLGTTETKVDAGTNRLCQRLSEPEFRHKPGQNLRDVHDVAKCMT